MTINIAVLAGARAQRQLALESGTVVRAKLRERGHRAWLVHVDGEQWRVADEDGAPAVDRRDLSFTNEAGEHLRFGFAFLAVHDDIGKGALQGYLDLLDIPYDSSGQQCSLISDDKHGTKLWLAAHEVPLAAGMLYHERAPVTEAELLSRVGLPCIVKPRRGGSALGTSKVSRAHDLSEAIAEGLRWDDELLVEAFVPGREVTCGVVRLDGRAHALPLTEYLLDGGVRTWALNQGTVPKQTPAQLPADVTERVQDLARRSYEALGCRGLARIDFRLDARAGLDPILLEVNTLPGLELRGAMLTQVVAAGMDLGELFETLMRDALAEHAARRRPGSG